MASKNMALCKQNLLLLYFFYFKGTQSNTIEEYKRKCVREEGLM